MIFLRQNFPGTSAARHSYDTLCTSGSHTGFDTSSRPSTTLHWLTSFGVESLSCWSCWLQRWWDLDGFGSSKSCDTIPMNPAFCRDSQAHNLHITWAAPKRNRAPFMSSSSTAKSSTFASFMMCLRELWHITDWLNICKELKDWKAVFLERLWEKRQHPRIHPKANIF